MRSIDFIQAVKESDKYYKEFEEQYAVFQIYQGKVADTLRAFHEVCDKGQINYQLAFGSLLGAVRDGGQIPWDYDVDVIVPTIERSKLIAALETYLGSEFYFFCIEQNEDCAHVILRIAPTGFDTRFLHVDVFFVAGLPEDKENAAKYKKEICELSLMYKAKNFNFFDRGTNSKKESVKMVLYKIKGMFQKKYKILEKYKKLSVKYPIDSSSHCCLADRFSGWYELPTLMLYDTQLFKTEIGTFRIPKEFDKILQIWYGSYMEIPSLESRMEEFKRHYEFLTKNCPLGEKNDKE